MRRGEQSSLILAAGLWVSLGLHIALGLGLARFSIAGVSEGGRDTAAGDRGEVPEPELPEPDELNPPKERELQLGVAGGGPATLTWMGFAEATDHSARMGPVEQSGMTLDPGSGGVPEGEAAPREVASAEPAPQPIPEIRPDERVLMPEAVEVAPAEPANPPTLTRAALRDAAERLGRATQEAADATEKFAASVQELFEAAPVEPEPPRPAHAAGPVLPPTPAPAAPPQPPRPATPKSGDGGGTPGILADREAIAVAVKNAPGVKPGKVLAAEGLEILTRQPRFAVTTMLTRRPRNPTVEVLFGRDGRVIRAGFVTDGRTVYNTGTEEIDQPILNAIYTWSARGKALEELDPADPKAGVRIMFTILLGG